MYKFLALAFVFAVSAQVQAATPASITTQGNYTFSDGLAHDFEGTLTLKEESADHIIYEGRIEIANFKREGKSQSKQVEVHFYKEDGKFFAFFCFNTFATQFRNKFALEALMPVDKATYAGMTKQVDMFGNLKEEGASSILFGLD